jgi:hypothetical protein
MARAFGHPLIASHTLGTSPRWGEEETVPPLS